MKRRISCAGLVALAALLVSLQGVYGDEYWQPYYVWENGQMYTWNAYNGYGDYFEYNNNLISSNYDYYPYNQYIYNYGQSQTYSAPAASSGDSGGGNFVLGIGMWSGYPGFYYPYYGGYYSGYSSYGYSSYVPITGTQSNYNTNVVYQPPAGYSQDTTVTTYNTCGDGWCTSTETQQSCPADCTPSPYCGDGACNNGETLASCPYDCKKTCGVEDTCGSTTTRTAYCGDKRCSNGETKYSCPADCGLPDYCGDGECNGAETKYNCPTDCGLAPYCGDGKCDKDETKYSCAKDCGLPGYCGDGTCSNTETKYTCALDCGAPKCSDPTGDSADEICRNKEILICKSGNWDFKKKVSCCVSSDCSEGYKCEYNRCVAKKSSTCNTCAGTPAAVLSNYCGDGKCNSGETRYSCPADCGPAPYCGDGVCSVQIESQSTCPQDCGVPPRHSVDVFPVGDECHEIDCGESQSFRIAARNTGNVAETLDISASGQAAAWVTQQSVVIVAPGGTEEWEAVVSVPASAEPGLYNVTILAQNSHVQASTVLHIDARLPEESGTVLVPVEQGSETNETAGTPTGALVAGEIAIPDWALVLAVLVVVGIFLILLIGKTSAAAKPVIATDGGRGLPAWATKVRK
jgi:hypothetical protein